MIGRLIVKDTPPRLTGPIELKLKIGNQSGRGGRPMRDATLKLSGEREHGMATSFDDDHVISIAVGRNLQWYGKTVSCIENLSPVERADLEKWDSERPNAPQEHTAREHIRLARLRVC